MRLLVVVPARDRWNALSRCLRSIEISAKSMNSDSRRAIQTVVVDDRSKPNLKERLDAHFPDVEVLASLGPGPGAARNTVFDREAVDGFLFTDSDCVVSECWLSVGYDWFAQGGGSLAQGPPWLFQERSNPELGRLESSLYRHLFSSYVDGDCCQQVDTRNLLVRSSVARDVQSFRFPTSMDTAAAEARVFGNLAKSLNVSISWLPTLRVHHEDPATIEAVLRQKYRHGSGRAHVWAAPPSNGHLIDRYFQGPVQTLKLPTWFVVPAHLAFLLGYREALAKADGDTEWWPALLDELRTTYSGLGAYCSLVSNTIGVSI